MAVNPDPRPGRWLLPLVVLGMVAFTWVFVSELKGSVPTEPTVASSQTTQPGTPTETSPTTSPSTVPGDPAVLDYQNSVRALADQLVAFQAEMAAVNGAWDASPKQIDAATAKSRLEALAASVGQWSQSVAQLVPPLQYTDANAALVDAANRAAAEANNALTGFTSSPTADARRAAASNFDVAVSDFQAALVTVGVTSP